MSAPTVTDALTDALARPEVRTRSVDPQAVSPCAWCQMIGAVCSFAVYWTPREDVLSDGYAECCRDCAPERVRRAVDDSIAGFVVTVEIAGGDS